MNVELMKPPTTMTGRKSRSPDCSKDISKPTIMNLELKIRGVRQAHAIVGIRWLLLRYSGRPIILFTFAALGILARNY